MIPGVTSELIVRDNDPTVTSELIVPENDPRVPRSDYGLKYRESGIPNIFPVLAQRFRCSVPKSEDNFYALLTYSL